MEYRVRRKRLREVLGVMVSAVFTTPEAPSGWPAALLLTPVGEAVLFVGHTKLTAGLTATQLPTSKDALFRFEFLAVVEAGLQLSWLFRLPPEEVNTILLPSTRTRPDSGAKTMSVQL